jgi:hypothetical protein
MRRCRMPWILLTPCGCSRGRVHGDTIVWTDGGCVDYRTRGIRVLLANIDIGWLRNPIYYAHAQNQVVIHSLPGFWPSQVAMAAAFSEHSPLALVAPALKSVAYGAALLAPPTPRTADHASKCNDVSRNTQETRHGIRIGRAKTLVFV